MCFMRVTSQPTERDRQHLLGRKGQGGWRGCATEYLLCSRGGARKEA